MSTPGIAVRDGEPWLVYAWWRSGTSIKDIYLVRPDGSGTHVILGDLPGSHGSPSWSPDGASLAFGVVDDATPGGSIWTAKPDGSAAAIRTDGDGECPDGLAHPSWSPDGSKLAFICYPDPGGKQGSVATLDLATGSVTRLTTVTWPEHLDGAPTWSPDGRSLAFSILHWDPTDQFIDGSLIAVVDAAGGTERRITTFDTNMSDPDWGPDGTDLATFSYDMGNMHTTPHPSNVYLVRPDGTGLRQLTHSSVDGNMRIVQPRWSPDGTRIVCSVGISQASNFTTDDLQLAFVDPAGGEPVLLSPTVHGSQPDVRPIEATP
jgi:Tol biopolymer transport system component